MIHFHLTCISVGKANGVQARLLVCLRRAPATAGSVEEIIADKAILKGVTRSLWQRMVAPGRSLITAIVEERKRQPHQGDVAGGAFRRPHAVAGRIRAHEHVQMLIFTFEKRKLIDRTTGNADGAWAGSVERHPIEHRVLAASLSITRPLGG